MKENPKEKITGFLQWYQDLYARQWYVEDPELFKAANKDQTVESNVPNSNINSPLQKFRLEIENCQKCPLWKTRTKFVFGTGNENAGIMFIGEAPGRDEDLQGIPFVGRAGQLLNKLLEHVQLKRSDVYIANILKSRPPNNRDPLPEEVEQCIPYLHRQIEIVRPKVLVALGRVAAQNLLNNQLSLTNMRNKIWSYRDIPMIVTFHPAYILRNNSMLNSAIEEMKFVVDYYHKIVAG